jgi:GAF domain-containing protein
MLTLPIVAKGKLLGIMRLLTGVHHHFTDEEIHFTNSLAEVCGIAIENARMYEELVRRRTD